MTEHPELLVEPVDSGKTVDCLHHLEALQEAEPGRQQVEIVFVAREFLRTAKQRVWRIGIDA